MSEKSRCCTCGFKWRTGLDGSHSCTNELIKTIVEKDEQLAQLADVLVGYREGSFTESMIRANQLKELESVKNLIDDKELILYAVDNLRDALADCAT